MTARKRVAQTAAEIARASEEHDLAVARAERLIDAGVAERTAVLVEDSGSEQSWEVPGYAGKLSARPITADNLRRELAKLGSLFDHLFDRWLATMEVSGDDDESGLSRSMFDLAIDIRRARATEVERAGEVTSAITGLALNHADLLAPLVAARNSRDLRTMLRSEDDFDRIVLALAYGLHCVQESAARGFVEDPRDFYGADEPATVTSGGL